MPAVDGRIRGDAFSAARAAVVFGLFVGASVALISDGAAVPERAMAAVACVFLGGVCSAGAATIPAPRRARLALAATWAGGVFLTAAVAVITATWDASILSGLGGALVAAGAAVLALGASAVARRWGVSDGGAVGFGAALPVVLLGWLFVADPWVEWDRDAGAIQRRAEVSLALSPLASIGAAQGGLGVDWQRTRWLYDGPAPGVPGLSVVGQYYPSRPTSPFVWTVVAGAAGLLLLSLGGNEVTAARPPEV